MILKHSELDSTQISAITKVSSIPYTQVDRTVVGTGRTFNYILQERFRLRLSNFAQEKVQRFQKSAQDGIYDLTILGYLNSANVTPYTDDSIKFAQC